MADSSGDQALWDRLNALKVGTRQEMPSTARHSSNHKPTRVAIPLNEPPTSHDALSDRLKFLRIQAEGEDDDSSTPTNPTPSSTDSGGINPPPPKAQPPVPHPTTAAHKSSGPSLPKSIRKFFGKPKDKETPKATPDTPSIPKSSHPSHAKELPPLPQETSNVPIARTLSKDPQLPPLPQPTTPNVPTTHPPAKPSSSSALPPIPRPQEQRKNSTPAATSSQDPDDLDAFLESDDQTLEELLADLALDEDPDLSPPEWATEAPFVPTKPLTQAPSVTAPEGIKVDDTPTAAAVGDIETEEEDPPDPVAREPSPERVLALLEELSLRNVSDTAPGINPDDEATGGDGKAEGYDSDDSDSEPMKAKVEQVLERVAVETALDATGKKASTGDEENGRTGSEGSTDTETGTPPGKPSGSVEEDEAGTVPGAPKPTSTSSAAKDDDDDDDGDNIQGEGEKEQQESVPSTPKPITSFLADLPEPPSTDTLSTPATTTQDLDTRLSTLLSSSKRPSPSPAPLPSADPDTRIPNLSTRLASLRALRPPSSPLNLPDVPTTIPSNPSKSNADNDSDGDMENWCTVCLQDATLICPGCDGEAYCNRCWYEMHRGPQAGFDEMGHRAEILERGKGKRRVMLGA